jgi:hypothetical protein
MGSFLRPISPLVVLVLAACGPAEQAPEAATGLTVLSIDPAPSLEIGTLEGDPSYTFDNVVGVVTLPSGEIAVADAGASEVRIFSPEGTFVRRVGRRGEGPGEFTNLMRVYPGEGDSIQAADGYPARLMFFDAAGGYARQLMAAEVTSDSLFPLDSWLHGRFWVEGALTEEDRAPVRAALDRLPAPTSPAFRRVRVSEGGALWIQEPAGSEAATRTWTIADDSGTPTSTIDLPARFEPYEVRGASLTGRWLDESDVHYVRRYSVSPTDERRAKPAWLTASAAALAPPTTTDQEFRATIVSGIKQMASAQEIHYSRSRTYTVEIDSLEWERPEGMEAHFVNADSRGWTAVFTHAELDRICGLTYGANAPAGWPGGFVLCAPEAARPVSISP